MMEQTLHETSEKMSKAVEALRRDLATIRTGRASPAIVDHIKVDYHGVPTMLKQMASITVPDARMLLIQPWDKTALSAIDKAIQKSDLGLNPASDGNAIRIKIPQLSEERRKDLVRLVHKRAEEGRVAVRNVRRNAVEELKQMERDKDISEDERKRAQEQVQQLTDTFVAEVDEVAKVKEAELLEV
ncbi:MAG: ribosome recycling factor [Chloroflexota bacterium]|nr:ribosome recycling factor [Chloroflexota bacterium]